MEIKAPFIIALVIWVMDWDHFGSQDTNQVDHEINQDRTVPLSKVLPWLILKGSESFYCVQKCTKMLSHRPETPFLDRKNEPCVKTP